ncbi:hypothetical protein EDB83DRAFT_479851 [Lactarius deliciosus]|nr:hypothetical protein EDB83DRAFT_479851 [Lactarius deliciosus]
MLSRVHHSAYLPLFPTPSSSQAQPFSFQTHRGSRAPFTIHSRSRPSPLSVLATPVSLSWLVRLCFRLLYFVSMSRKNVSTLYKKPVSLYRIINLVFSISLSCANFPSPKANLFRLCHRSRLLFIDFALSFVLPRRLNRPLSDTSHLTGSS